MLYRHCFRNALLLSIHLNMAFVFQVFVRRILQVSSELQDARDIIQNICKPPRLTQREYELIVCSNFDDLFEDPSVDPSVRFFGIDWQQTYGKCFSLSLNIQIFRTQVLNNLCIDLVLLNSILKDLCKIEVDATSHCEAIMQGRLSKSQIKLIKQEQCKFRSFGPPSPAPSAKVSKSKSFRDTSSKVNSQRAARQISKYKKNKTTDLHKLQQQDEETSSNNNNIRSKSSTLAPPSCRRASQLNNNNNLDEWEEVLEETLSTKPRRKSSFMQNVSSMFKSIK